MAKKTKKLSVLMLQTVAGIGREWEIIETSYAHARNQLIPQWFAQEIDAKTKQALLEKQKNEARTKRELIEKKHNIAEILHTQKLEFKRNGKDGHVYGSVSEKDIVEAIQKKFQITLTKKHIYFPEEHHIKTAGEHEVKIHISDDVYIKMNVCIQIEEV